jgi:hypothetical protein
LQQLLSFSTLKSVICVNILFTFCLSPYTHMEHKGDMGEIIIPSLTFWTGQIFIILPLPLPEFIILWSLHITLNFLRNFWNLYTFTWSWYSRNDILAQHWFFLLFCIFVKLSIFSSYDFFELTSIMVGGSLWLGNFQQALNRSHMKFFNSSSIV